MECWDAHIPVERHRGDNFSAIEKRAPANPEEANSRRILLSSTPQASSGSACENEILVVVSKVKKYIADKSGMNTSASTMEALTRRIRLLCDRAIENARADGRKTVMDRDIP